MKKWTQLIALLVAVTMLSGCNLIGVDRELDAKQVVAKVGDTQIIKGDWEKSRDELVAYYAQMYSYYGMTMDTSESAMTQWGEDALTMLVENEVIKQKLASLGLDELDEETRATIDTSAQDEMDYYRSYYQAVYFSDADPESATLSEAVDERLAQDGYTMEGIVTQLEEEQLYTIAREYAIKDVAVEDAAVQTAYDERVAEQKGEFEATPTAYASSLNNNSTVYYVPAGYRGIKHVLVKLDSEKQSEISTLESTLTTNASTRTNLQSQLADLTATPAEGTEYTADEQAALDSSVEAINAQLADLDTSDAETSTQLAALKESAYGEIYERAQMVYAMATGDVETANALLAKQPKEVSEEAPEAEAGEEAQATASEATPDEASAIEAADQAPKTETITGAVDFDVLMAEYGEDPGMQSEPAMTTGYAICEGLTLYETPFQDAAMALEKVGDISGIVEGTNGYHILYYASDIPEGEVAFDTVKETVHDELLKTAQDEAYSEAVAAWVDEAKVKTYPNAMKTLK